MTSLCFATVICKAILNTVNMTITQYEMRKNRVTDLNLSSDEYIRCCGKHIEDISPINIKVFYLSSLSSETFGQRPL